MQTIDHTLLLIENFIWGPPLLALILGTGVYLTFLLKGMQFRYLWYALKQVVATQKKGAKGDISHFEALMTSLAGAIGTGSIVGVATGIAIGGMGSLFWMWVTAFFGMATKYAESVLAVRYRTIDQRGEMIGGPMHYIEKGLGWNKTALLFALFGSIAAIGTGNMVQINAIAEAVNSIWDINPWITGLVNSILIAIIILGGVKSIGRVAGVLVPFMALFYFLGGGVILLLHLDQIPQVFRTVIVTAFQGQAAIGGFVGGSLMLAMQAGVSRSIFSNEAGLGISSIAAAAARTDNPGRQAMITMTGALFSTLITCTITGFVIGVTGILGTTDDSGKMLNGATMAIAAFDSVIFGGRYIVIIGLILFAFSTVIAWAYYGEKCFEYLLGERSVIWYRILFSLIIIPSAAIELQTAWYFSNIANAAMAIPNLIALIALSSVIVSETRQFLKIADKEIAENRLNISNKTTC